MARYTAVARELEILRNQDNDTDNAAITNNSQDGENIDFSQTDMLANEKQHIPLARWFKGRNIKTTFDYSAVDMSGYYDEAAQKIGENYVIFQDIIGKIGWSYRKNHTGINLDLKKYSQQDAGSINKICREFYSHTLFSGYSYQKQEKIIRLKLQSATPIYQFFTGGWLEWYALSTVLQVMSEKNIQMFSCARSAKVQFGNQDTHELDVLLLTPRQDPIIIECKTGEYRRDINKYLDLRKRLGLSQQNFIMLVTDIDETQAKAFSSMYQLTFLTIGQLPEYIKQIT